MDFVIIGAGSVGGYFGARLQQAGHSVTFLVRAQRRLLLRERGLRIESPLGNIVLNVQAETNVNSISKCDVVIVAVRNYDLDGALKNIAQLAMRGASVISLLNGVEHIERILMEIPPTRIIGGSAYIDSRLGSGGEIVHRSQLPKIALGSIQGNPASEVELRNTASAFSDSGIKTEIMDDLFEGLWQKYLFVLLGSFTAVAASPIGRVLANPWCVNTLHSLLNEFSMVARSTGVQLNSSHSQIAMLELERQPAEWTSLVYEDLLNHRRSEIESLWGYIVKKGTENSVNIPLSIACYGVLKMKEI